MGSSASRNETRRAVRRRADAHSTLRAGGAPVDTFVHDVSATGARVECSTGLLLGDFVTIGLAGVGAVRAVVVWKREDQYGLDFAVPLTADDVSRAFSGGTVVSLTPARDRAQAADAGPGRIAATEDEEEGLYAEGNGWLSLMLFLLLAGTAAAVAIIQGWLP